MIRARRDDHSSARSSVAKHPIRSTTTRDAHLADGPSDRAIKWVPVISAANCTGCNLCIEACGPKCLELIDGIAVLTAPEACGSEEHCIPVCEYDAIRMEWVTTTRRSA